MAKIKPTEKESNIIQKLLKKMTPEQIIESHKAFQAGESAAQLHDKLNKPAAFEKAKFNLDEAIEKAEQQISFSSSTPFIFYNSSVETVYTANPVSYYKAQTISQAAKNPLKSLTDLSNAQFEEIMAAFEKFKYTEVQRVEFLAKVFKDVDWVNTIKPINSTDWVQKLTVNHANQLIKELKAQLEFWEEVEKWNSEQK